VGEGEEWAIELISEMVRLCSLEYRLLKEEAMNPTLRMFSLSEKSSLVLSILPEVCYCESIYLLKIKWRSKIL
jgi:hypothetical protein